MATPILTNEDFELRIGGQLVRGLADIPGAVMFPERSPVRTITSADGRDINYYSGDRGGVILVTLFPASPTLRQFGRWWRQVNDRQPPDLDEGNSAINKVNGATCEMKGGSMVSGKDFFDFGGDLSNLRYAFRFEQILGNWDAFDHLASAGP